MSRLFGGQRRAIGGRADRVCEGRPVHDDAKELRSFLIDMMTCQQVLVNNVSGSQLYCIAITQKVCLRFRFKLREKVREVASRHFKSNVVYEDLVDLVSKRLDQLDTCYAELKDSGSKRNAVGYESKPKLARANGLKLDKSSPAPDRPVCTICELHPMRYISVRI